MTYPPAMMRKPDAAQYCGLSVVAFEREVSTLNLPQPVLLGKKALWYRPKLDKALAVIAGDISDDWKGIALYDN